MPHNRRAVHPLEDPSGLHAGYGRFAVDNSRDLVLFLPSEEVYYRAWCTHFGLDFDAATQSYTQWSRTFDELRRRYYETHPELIVAMEREFADLPPLDRALMIAVRTQDAKRFHREIMRIKQQGIDVPELFLRFGADD